MEGGRIVVPVKNKRICYERVEKFISPIYFADVNLYKRLYPAKETEIEFLGHFAAGDARFRKYEEVTKEEFNRVKVGDSFGPTWSTHWFKVIFVIPSSWKGEEVRLRWNSNSEAMIWMDGKPVQGLTGGDGQQRTDFIVTRKSLGSERVTVYIEMAANGMFGAGKGGMINPPDPTRNFTLSMVEIAVFNRKAYEVIRDLKILLGMVKELPDDNQRAWQALYTANDVINCFQPESADSYERSFRLLEHFFRQKNGDSQHTVHAVGHCHIDSAWLWPYDETIRKCARSWSSTIDLMKRYPDFKFACSQAQQFAWIKDHYPSLYQDIKHFVNKGQFIPVGGTWIEMVITKEDDPGFAPPSEESALLLRNWSFKTKKRQVTVYIEMAANGMFGAGKGGMINPPDPTRNFTLSMVEIAVFNRKAYEVIRDLKILLGMVKELPDDNQRAWQALFTANDVINCFQPESADSYERSFRLLEHFFRQKNGDSQHTVHAVGHCHIDSAWLWPYDETIRKCARSWSSTIDLMKRYPDFKFACSQAQQFAWIKDYYPSLYQDIKHFVNKGQFIPVGGTWIEMDGNLPSGESFIRQFLYGQKFFQAEFGRKCNIFWLPDTFGYSPQLPQIMKQCGMEFFVTQKLSWNLINKFPHSTFLWQGIDGTRCLTHFPPADTYESSAGVDDILKSSTKNKDMGHVNDSLLLFGYGDGGGGPTEEMIENCKRMENVDGLPRVTMSTPAELFRNFKPVANKLHVWVGELYLELHQGTFTTHADVKSWNRRCEFCLRDAEFMSVISWILGNRAKGTYPTDKLDEAWKKLMLNQFHDVLPGTSIKEVYDVAVKYYVEIESCTDSLIAAARNEISRSSISDGEMEIQYALFNTCSWRRRRVIRLDDPAFLADKANINITRQLQLEGSTTYAMVDVPAMGYNSVIPLTVSSEDEASIKMDGESVILKNGKLKAKFDKCGHLLSLQLRDGKKESVASPLVGNQFVLFDDIPLYWDAWDIMPYYKETRRILDDRISFEIKNKGPLQVSFEVSIKVNESCRIDQTVYLHAESPYIGFWTEIKDWNENRKLLRVEFPCNVLADQATYEIQFGHVQRPTHGNTSWDWAKYEVCGHKWVDVSEYDFGVSLLSREKYGYSVSGNTMGISLLRSAKSPDETADMGSHVFDYAVMPHRGTFQSAGVIQEAYSLIGGLRLIKLHKKEVRPRSFFSLSSQAVILDTVKKAEDVEDAIILRLYEAYGGKATTELHSSFDIEWVTRCNMLEEPLGKESSIPWNEQKGCILDFKPFEIITLMLHLK